MVIYLIEKCGIFFEQFLCLDVTPQVGPELFIVIIEYKVENMQNSGLRSPFLGIKTAFKIR